MKYSSGLTASFSRQCTALKDSNSKLKEELNKEVTNVIVSILKMDLIPVIESNFMDLLAKKLNETKNSIAKVF